MKLRSILGVLLAATCATFADDQSVELKLHGPKDGSARKVSVIQRGAEIASIEVPQRILEGSLRKGLSEALWSPTKAAVALACQDKLKTFAVVFVQNPDGRFSAADISAVEVGNFGKLGPKPVRFRRLETKPVKWLKRSDDLFQVVMETKAWDAAGKVVTATEPLIVKRDGTPLWR